jgi:hypothetical protein
MKMYFAGVPGGDWKKREKELSKYWKHRLWSYHIHIKELKADLDEDIPRGKCAD